MVVFGGEHPLNFDHEQRVALARTRHERAPFLRRTLQRKLVDLADRPEVLRRYGTGGSVVHKNPPALCSGIPGGSVSRSWAPLLRIMSRASSDFRYT